MEDYHIDNDESPKGRLASPFYIAIIYAILSVVSFFVWGVILGKSFAWVPAGILGGSVFFIVLWFTERRGLGK